MPVSRSLRFQILRRDGHTCRYCGATAPDVKLTVDHVVPEALGGPDEASNLVTACEPCNGGKAATPPDAAHVAQVASDALRWAEAVQLAASDMLANRERLDASHRAFDEKWTSWSGNTAEDWQELPRPADWASSVDQFLAAGLPLPVLLDCIDTAMQVRNVKAQNIFRYMCGIAWRKINHLHESARGHLGSENTETLPFTSHGRLVISQSADEQAAAELIFGLIVSLHCRGLRKPLMLIRRDLTREAEREPSTQAEAVASRFAKAALVYAAEVINDVWDTRPFSPGFLFPEDPPHDPHDQLPPGATLPDDEPEETP